jgi:diguanylate cyclase (GGDEF)-like protein
MHSIRIKITAITLAAILISLVTLGGIGLVFIGAEKDRDATEKIHLICESERKTLEAYLSSLKQSVDMAAHLADDLLDELDDEIIEKAKDDPRDLDSYLTEHCSLVQQAFGSISNHTNGVETYYYCINADLGSSEHGFFYSKVGRESYEEQEKLNSDDLDPDDIEHTTWYYTPARTGEAVWVGPYTAHYLNEVWTVSYVTPIFKDEYLIGVIGMDILLDTMIERIDHINVYDTGFLSLLSSEGIILYHPDHEIGAEPEIATMSVGREVFLKESSEDAMIRYTIHGQERQLAYETLSNGMKLVAVAPVSEITASWRQLSSILIAVTAFILIVTAIVIMFLMGAVTHPLQNLTAASRRLADGDYDVELEYKGKDEIGVLTRSFRQMRDQLKLYISDLNSRANTDALTGVRNKGAFDIAAGRLNDKIRHAKEMGYPEFAVVLFDCNNLKTINDRYGHDHGDTYLVTASTAISSTFSRSPIYRIGGDEFVVLLKEEDYRDRERLFFGFDRVAEQINNVADHPWERVSISRGMAVFSPGGDQNVDAVLRRADERMYESKRRFKASGRSNYPR